MTEEMSPIRPEFLINRDGQTVARAINAHLEHLLWKYAQPFELAISTAYFNPGGFSLLAEMLEKIGTVRLVLGAEPEGPERELRQLDPTSGPKDMERARLRRALQGHVRTLEDDRDLLGFSLEEDAAAQRLIAWLKSGQVQVRRYEQGFLHGKTFLVTTDDEGAIVGSSNLTYAGLAVNNELNLGQYQPHVVTQVRGWFEDVWEHSAEFDLASIFEARYLPHSPYLIYLRMLWERYGAEVEQEAGDGAGIHLTGFQQDGVWRAQRILEDKHGVLVADGVGLGKTFIAGELIRKAVRERRQRVLLVSPAALRDGPWRAFLEREQLGVKNVSYEELSADRQLNPKGDGDHLVFDKDEYAMVVIDEAQAYRNPDAQRAAVLRKLLEGTPPKDLVLLTATPVNNSLWDLYYLLSYFIRNDAAFAHAGIRSLKAHFGEAMALDPDDLSPDKLFDVLDVVVVRRTRHFVKRYYPNETVRMGGVDVPIRFPTPQVRRVAYDLDNVLPGFFDRFAHALDCGDGECEHDPELADCPVLRLARYVPSKYLKGGHAESFELQLVGLLRSGLLKRFESSAHAFALTCERMAASHDAFLAILDSGWVVKGSALTDWMATDSDDFDSEALDEDDRQPAVIYDVETLRSDVLADRDLLRAFAVEARAVALEDDPKLAVLVNELIEIVVEADEEGLTPSMQRDDRKVIIFSYYADTVNWVADYLGRALAGDERLRAYRDRLAVVSGQRGDREDVLWGFAPRTTDAPVGRDQDKYDLLLTTDVLAEGVNLQQARHIINYDLPWNPMRIVQRHGRIDRIGSPHDRVFLRCFFPDVQLDALLRLEERLQRKIAQAAASVGVEGEIIPGSKTGEVTFAETRDEILALRREDATLLELGGEKGDAYSGEAFRQELRRGLEPSSPFNTAVRGLAWGSGSGLARVGAVPGFVFCARVGNHPSPQFRYVACEEGAKPEVVGDTLTCLFHAEATPETERVLDEQTHRRGYDAWDRARQHIFDEWQKATDPRNLQPKVPKTMRDAAELLRAHPPADVPQAEVERLIDAVEAPYGVRIEKMIRGAMRGEELPAKKAVIVAAKVKELGLERPEPVQALPVIELADVHLVCWLAIVPAASR
jgi:hypothetical protein